MPKRPSVDEEKQYAEEFGQKVSAPDREIQSIQPGYWIQIKWQDAPDSVVLVTNVEHKRKRLDRIEFFDPESWDEGSVWGKLDISRIVHVLGPITVPQARSVLRIVNVL